jgi:hypothetical protein
MFKQTQGEERVMLDAYIIERIRREREQRRRNGVQIPLHIEPPPPDTGREGKEKREEAPGRGTTIVDFGF